MLTLRRRDALLGFATCLVGCPRPEPVTAGAAPRTDARWERVVRAFEKSLEDAPAPGGAVGVVLDGKPAFAAARGVRRMGTTAPVSTPTLFRLESVTKTFTAIAALSLVEQKALDLDAPISDYVAASVPASVTLRRLLTHTAGIARNGITNLRDVRRGHEYEDLFTRNALTLGPADKFEYSNTGYLLVGAAIERAAKASFADVLRDRMTKPLGMTTATADSAGALTFDHADGFGLDWDNRERIFDPPSLDPYVQRPAGGLHASIDDLCAFAARFNAGVPEVLRADTFAEMTLKRVATSEANVYYGYGIYVTDSPHGPVWTHTGGGHGSTAFFLCVPRARFAVAAVTNAGRYAGWRDVRRAAEEAFLGSAVF